MPRFYCDGPIPCPVESWKLPEGVFRHAIKVLRLSMHDEIVLFNGLGGEYLAQLVGIDKHQALVKIDKHVDVSRESTINTCLAQALLSHDKMDWVIQKAVELGINQISPIMTERSLVRIGQDKMGSRLARWQSIIVSACEQSGRTQLPTIAPLFTLANWVKSLPEVGTKIVLNPMGQKTLTQLTHSKEKPLIVTIGPEGGFGFDELKLLEAHGFEQVSLGPRVLRTETAGLSVLAIVQQIWGDFAG